MVFWRALNLELWLKEFFPKINEKKIEDRRQKKEFKPEIVVGDKKYARKLISTHVFQKGEQYAESIAQYVAKLQTTTYNLRTNKWFVVATEKIIATAQNRSYFIWDIHPGFFAKLLSRFVSRVSYGIGLGSPWTMQLAIQEVGLSRILFATLASVCTRPFGIRGVFYQVAGRAAAGIDGPTEYSLYPANVSAKLLPKDPNGVCNQIDNELRTNHQSLVTSLYLGSVVIDANDIGRNILGNSTGIADKIIEGIFKDNPMGQTDEQTPLAIVSITTV